MKVEIRTPDEKPGTPIEVMYMIITTRLGNRYIIRRECALDIIKDDGRRMEVFPESSNHILIK